MRLLFVAFAVVLTVPAVALADNAVADGDGVTPLTDNPTMDFSNVGCNVASDKDALVAITRQGSATGTNTFKNGATVTVSASVSGDAGLSAAMDSSTITLPSDWVSKSNGTLSNSVKSIVTVNSSAPGSHTGTVTYTATGLNVDNPAKEISRTDTVNVTWATGSCDTTAPSVSSISTANTNPTNTTGNLNWTVQFSENVSGVDASDFATDSSGGLGGSPAVTNVAQGANASVYTVTASSGSGSGNLGLNLNDNDDSIKDAANNPLGGAGTGTVGSGGTGNGSFDGDDYVIDRDAPAATGTAVLGPNFAATDTYTAGDWTNQSVRVTFTCADTGGTSGLTSTSVPQTLPDFTTETSASGATATFSGTCKDNAGNTAAASTFGPIKIDKTAPSVTVPLARATADHNGWYNAPVGYGVSASNDALSGIDSCQANDTYTGPDDQNASVSRECTDLAGNVGSGSKSFQYDNTNPTISGSRSPAANGFGWNNEAVAVSYTCGDNLSGVDGACGPNETLPNEAAGQSSTGNVADTAGNTASTTVSPINIDLTDPVVTAPASGVSGTLGLNGWYTSAVTQTFNATDALSGIAGSASNSKTSTTEGQSVTLTSDPFSDKADNTKTGSATFKIDLSNPLLNITGAASGTAYTACGAAPTRPTYDPFDAISGLDGTEGDSWDAPATGAGTYTYTAHAKDLAGRTTTETRTYTRTYGSAYTGLLQPINAGSTPRSTFKLGSTVPLKFLLACGSTPITNANATFSLTKVDSTVESAVNETVVELPASTGNQFRLSDATTGQYIYNLSTKPLSQGTYNLKVDLHDGSNPQTTQVTFDLKK